MTGYSLGPTSRKRLIGVDTRLQAVVRRAIGITKQDFTVVEGLRTRARQKELYAQGRTKPGDIVTWTLNSKHILGLAVDLCPFNNGELDWTAGVNFDEIAAAMFQAAKELATPIVWGADWDRDGNPRERGETDSPHFQLAQEAAT